MEFEKGKRFGKLTVIGPSDLIYGKHKHLCLCDCGNYVNVGNSNLKLGNSKSCGCGKPPFKHHSAYTKLYTIWCAMISRCNWKGHSGYKHYGGRGIKVCPEWRDFINFKIWANNNGYRESLSIERKDVNLGYNPNNCKWILIVEQVYNKTTTIYCEINGEILNTKQVFEKYGINKKVLYYRISKGFKDIELIKPIETKYAKKCSI